ncbi:MAG: flagellar assembly protein T N-terminal domain-containing protein [Candidatus Polarisedimenticolaceae bacterium]|nr:flagellar assembly protein T N-terminal domain-containing protein [Candidatus Polarisedimenticolaceae bacterium]
MRHLALLITTLLCLCSAPVLAAAVEARGSAVITNGDVGSARLAAYQNALRQASMMQNAKVNSTYATGLGSNVIDSIQVRSSSRLSNANIIDEHIANGIITLLVSVTMEDGSGSCGGFDNNSFRKKVTAVYFPLLDAAQIGTNDYYGFQRGIPTELLQRLSASGDFLVRDASNQSLHHDPLNATSIASNGNKIRPLVNTLQENLGIQYVISGVIRNLGHELPPSFRLTRKFELFNTEWNPLGLSFKPGWPGIENELGLKWQPNERNIEVEFFIHDAYTGELLARHRHAKVVKGYIKPDQPVRFGTYTFYNDPYGAAFSELLEREVTAIRRLLSCREFSVKVLGEEGHHLYIDMGRDTRIKKGDTITLYKSARQGPVFGVDGGSYQFSEPSVTANVIRVYAGYSVVQLKERRSPVTFQSGEYISVR